MRIKYRKPIKKKTNPTPEWLQSIQLNSWEAELLVSALLLYALFQVPDYLVIFFRKNIPEGNILRILSNGLIDGIKLLRWGYIIHIVIRGIWVGSVGFSFVFPQGIIKEKVRFKGKFREELNKDINLVGFVLKLEQLSSIIYGISFMLFGLLLGVFAYLFILLAIFQYGIVESFSANNSWLSIIAMALSVLYLFIGLLMLIDFITNGYLRKDKSVARWFYPIAKFYRAISFSILYRRSLLVLQTNLPPMWRKMLPFFLILFVGTYWYLGDQYDDRQEDTYFRLEESVFNPLYYESTRGFDEYLMVTIPDQIISNQVLHIFVREVEHFKNIYSKREGFKMGHGFGKLSKPQKVNYVSQFLKVEIDGLKMEPASILSAEHRATLRSGYQLLFDLQEVARGPHELVVGIDTIPMNANQRADWRNEELRLGVIPFYFDKP
jgi:hypothetical protein